MYVIYTEEVSGLWNVWVIHVFKQTNKFREYPVQDASATYPFLIEKNINTNKE